MPIRPKVFRRSDPNPVHKPYRDNEVQRIRGRQNTERREKMLKRDPLCAWCRHEGRYEPATELDHIIALQFNGTEAESNTWMICSRHHAIKSAYERQHKRPMPLPEGLPPREERTYALA